MYQFSIKILNEMKSIFTIRKSDREKVISIQNRSCTIILNDIFLFRQIFQVVSHISLYSSAAKLQNITRIHFNIEFLKNIVRSHSISITKREILLGSQFFFESGKWQVAISYFKNSHTSSVTGRNNVGGKVLKNIKTYNFQKKRI